MECKSGMDCTGDLTTHEVFGNTKGLGIYGIHDTAVAAKKTTVRDTASDNTLRRRLRLI